MKSRTARPYRQTLRAQKAAETGRRILDAALEQFSTREFDEVTLTAIAGAAGVTKQTVIHRFGNKEGLFAALVSREAPRIEAERIPPGGAGASLEEAVHALVGHYERDGQAVLNFLKQEGRSKAASEVVASGRAVHDRWVRTHCSSVLSGLRGVSRKRALAAAVAATDLYVWKLLRLDRGMTRREVEKTMLILLGGIGAQTGER